MFPLFLFFVIFLAWLAPSVGGGTGAFSLASVARWGVAVIFFFYGLRLNRAKIQAGLANYRLHILVQGVTFGLFPLLILPLVVFFGQGESRLLWLGIFFLATLPGTVSSAVVMVHIARGNVPAAIFDASLSSLLGIVLTPLWMRIFLAGQPGAREISQVVILLIVQVLLPISLGLALHRFWGFFVERHARALGRFDQTIILLLVYTSFCHSFSEKMFANLSFWNLIALTVGLSALFFLVYGIIHLFCRLLRFSREDTITALFCGSKKSLVHGTVMAQVLLADPRLAGVLILPTMLYHAMQLLFAGILARAR